MSKFSDTIVKALKTECEVNKGMDLCPFCGGTAMYVPWPRFRGIVCSICGANMPMHNDEKVIELRARWNKRVET